MSHLTGVLCNTLTLGRARVRCQWRQWIPSAPQGFSRRDA